MERKTFLLNLTKDEYDTIVEMSYRHRTSMKGVLLTALYEKAANDLKEDLNAKTKKD